MFQANAVQTTAFQIGAVAATPPVVVEDTRGKGAWDPYWYKPRAKNKKKREEVLRFLDETATIDAPEEIQETVEVAREAAQEYLALADTGHQREAQKQLAEALDRIDAFYEAARAEVARLRQQEEEDEDDWLLLN